MQAKLNMEENWKNQANKGRKSRGPKSLQASQESRAAQQNETLQPPKLRLLENGSLGGFVSDGDKQVQLKNTCNLDSICHLLAVAYVDSKTAREFISDASDKNLIMKRVKLLATEGAVITARSGPRLEGRPLNLPPGFYTLPAPL